MNRDWSGVAGNLRQLLAPQALEIGAEGSAYRYAANAGIDAIKDVALPLDAWATYTYSVCALYQGANTPPTGQLTDVPPPGGWPLDDPRNA